MTLRAAAQDEERDMVKMRFAPVSLAAAAVSVLCGHLQAKWLREKNAVGARSN